MLFNDEITRLEEGDTVAYNQETGMIKFLRKNQALPFSNGSTEVLIHLPKLNFLVFIKILAETNGLDCPSSLQEIDTYPLVIGKRQWLSYIF